MLSNGIRFATRTWSSPANPQSPSIHCLFRQLLTSFEFPGASIIITGTPSRRDTEKGGDAWPPAKNPLPFGFLDTIPELDANRLGFLSPHTSLHIYFRQIRLSTEPGVPRNPTPSEARTIHSSFAVLRANLTLLIRPVDPAERPRKTTDRCQCENMKMITDNLLKRSDMFVCTYRRSGTLNHRLRGSLKSGQPKMYPRNSRNSIKC